MGLYSVNRIGALNPFSNTTSVDEMAEIMQEIDEAVEYGLDESGPSIYEFGILLQEYDQMMFDAMLESEFIEVANSRYMTEAEAEENKSANSETKKVKIGEKIKSVLAWLKKTITTAVSNLISKISEIFDADKKIVDQYEKYLTADRYDQKAFLASGGIKNMAYPKNQAIHQLEKLMKDSADHYYSIFERMDWSSKEKVQNTIQREVPDAKGINERVVSALFDKEVQAFAPTITQLQEAISNMKNKKGLISGAKKVAAELIAASKNYKSDVKSGLKAAKKDTSEGAKETVDMYTLYYQVISKLCSAIATTMSVYVKNLSKCIASYRATVLACGRFVSKNPKAAQDAQNQKAGEDLARGFRNVATEESAIDSLVTDSIVESSNIYVFDKLGYGY